MPCLRLNLKVLPANLHSAALLQRMEEAGYDAQQEAIVNIAKGGKFILLK
jgi:hypothetical protein